MQRCFRQALRSTRVVAKGPAGHRCKPARWQGYASESTSLSTNQREGEFPDSTPSRRHRTAIPRPSRREGRSIEAWLSRLETVLPPNLRQASSLDASTPHVQAGLRPGDIASFVADAWQSKGHDILLELSRTGRWRAMVWLATHMIDSMWKGNPATSWKLPRSPFGHTASLDDLVESSIELEAVECSDIRVDSLDKCVLSNHPFSRGEAFRARLGHQMLGQIWESLGAMIIEDAVRCRDTVQPEILELIATLHSRGIMPDSIYSFSPERSHIAGTQPPTLRLLSSQMMTGLSDATWKGRQAVAIELAQSSGRLLHFDGPELASSDYRIRVAGIRHEIWLEMVLWSCLHGGWTLHGAAVLEKLIKIKDQAWVPLSWREIVSPMIKAGDESEIDWERLEYLFTHGPARSATEDVNATSTAERTISSEVVSAYVDAVINSLSSGVGERGIGLGQALTLVLAFKRYLEQHDFGLESTSWDAVMQRILEAESLDIEQAPGLAELLLSLSGSYGKEEASGFLPTRDEAWRPKTPYLADGSALSLGLAHRTLSAYIQRGEFAGAFRTFRELQARTDNNKRLAIAAFFQKLKDGKYNTDAEAVSFQSPIASIKYPAMFPMLPATVLSPFLDLVGEVKAFDFGSWLVVSQDVDGPTIGPPAYRNPLMIPALIRFLAASGNEMLLAKLLRTINRDSQHRGLPAEILLAVLEGHFLLNNPKAAVATFERILRSCSLSTSTTETMLAMLCREAIKHDERDSPVRDKLYQCLRGDFNTERKVRRNVVAILMHISEDTKAFCRAAIELPQTITVYPEVEAFNMILDSHTTRNGSAAGRTLLCTFSQTATRATHAAIPEDDEIRHTGVQATTGNVRPDSVYTPHPDSLDLEIAQGRKDLGSVRVGGRFTPNASTVRIVLAKRLQELRSMANKDTPEHFEKDETVVWAQRLLGSMGMRWEDIRQETTGEYERTKMAEA